MEKTEKTKCCFFSQIDKDIVDERVDVRQTKFKFELKKQRCFSTSRIELKNIFFYLTVAR